METIFAAALSGYLAEAASSLTSFHHCCSRLVVAVVALGPRLVMVFRLPWTLELPSLGQLRFAVLPQPRLLVAQPLFLSLLFGWLLFQVD
jgi:hypothetical protein